MNWFWLNMPLAALIVAAVSGIPLWLVIKHPDTGPDAAAAKPAAGPAPTAEAGGMLVYERDDDVLADTAASGSPQVHGGAAYALSRPWLPRRLLAGCSSGWRPEHATEPLSRPITRAATRS